MCDNYLTKTYLKSPEQVFVGALGQLGASTITTIPNFKDKLWLFGKAMWGWALSWATCHPACHQPLKFSDLDLKLKLCRWAVDKV